MKIIDLLNKIANDELEDGFKFKWKQYIITYKKTKDGVLADSLTLINASFIADLRFKLDDEIEIIEEQEYEFEEIKELDILNTPKSVKTETINQLIRNQKKLINKYIADKEKNDGR